MHALNGNPAAIRQFVENNLSSFNDRRDFYRWAHETLNGPDSARQTDWFLAASQVNESDALGTVDDLGAGLLGIVDTKTLRYIHNAGLGLAEHNVQTFLSLYFGEPIAGVDPVAPPGTCGIQLSGDALDLKLVEYEQYRLSEITDDYFTNDPNAGSRDDVEDNLNYLLNYNGLGGFIADDLGFGDADTLMVIQHFWPDGDFDYTNVNDRILLGQSLVNINNGVPWRN